MKKTILFLAITIVVVIGYWLVSPLFINKKVSEEFPVLETNDSVLPMITQPELVAQGTFAGFDSVHQGSGHLKILKTSDGYVVRFEDDFKVTNGPDLYVGFGKDGKYVKGSEISSIKGNIGSQNYQLPKNVNLEDYDEVWIWCKAFSVPFARAGFSFSEDI